MSRRLQVTGVAVALATVGAACAERMHTQDSPAPVLAQRSDAIQGGAADSASTFAVSIVDDGDGVCSGTLIAPNLVLTARHCVALDNGGDTVDCAHDVFDPPYAASTRRVSLDATSPAFDDAEYKVTKIIVPAKTAFCGNDLALLLLDKVVPAALAKPATPAIDPPLTNRAKYGTKLTAIGYGTTGPGKNDDGTRRARPAVPITCIPGDATLDCDVADYDMTAAEMAAGNGLCEGDSGSGAYEPASLAAGSPIVMGVLSRAGETASQCADAIYGRTDTASAMLIAGAKEAAAAGGYATPSWADPSAQPVPEAGVDTDSGATTVRPEDDAGPAAEPGTTTTGGCALAPARAAGRATHLGVAVFGIMLLASRRRRARA